MPRTFTLDEANALVERIRPWVKEILDIRQRIMDRMPEVWPVLARSLGNGGSPIASAVDRDYRRIDDLYHRITALGAEIKDVNTGLIDFRSLRDDREVYLCWQYPEDRIRYWHDIEAGFTGRQALD